MVGLIVIFTSIVLLIGYLWLIYAAASFVNRKTGSHLAATIAVLVILVLTFGDTIFNNWYHKEVLCKRDDVGIKVFKEVELPAEYINEQTGEPTIPYPYDKIPFFMKFSVKETRETHGLFPWTKYMREERRIVVNETGETLAQFVTYNALGGWWTYPLDLFNENSLIGWLSSRRHAPSCFDGIKINGLLSVSSYFILINQGAKNERNN